MSGPVSTTDAGAAPGTRPPADHPAVEVLDGRATEVGGMPVVRALPKRARRTIGAWCFVDHFGPADVTRAAMNVGPHPHIGLQTVTWVLAGSVLHRDSLGYEQLIRPGQLNLMTAGRGVAHAEETPGDVTGSLHGLQLWVAQPDSTRWGDPAFEHHGALPEVSLGVAQAVVLVGDFASARSPARFDTPLVGADLRISGKVVLPLDPAFEHGLVVVEGAALAGGREIVPGVLAYFGRGRGEVEVRASPGSRLLLLGGEPFDEPILMWWNFVARTHAEIDDAYRDWEAGSRRFGTVCSPLARMPAPRPQWGVK